MIAIIFKAEHAASATRWWLKTELWRHWMSNPTALAWAAHWPIASRFNFLAQGCLLSITKLHRQQAAKQQLNSNEYPPNALKISLTQQKSINKRILDPLCLCISILFFFISASPKILSVYLVIFQNEVYKNISIEITIFLTIMTIGALLKCALLSLVNIVVAHQCGELLFSKGFTIRGEAITRGQWPYLVALVNVAKNAFFCGGTLISAKHVLTGKICDRN